MKLDLSKEGSIRVALGDVLPNLGSIKLKGVGTLSGSPVEIGPQVAAITKPFAFMDEMVSSVMTVSMHKRGAIPRSADEDLRPCEGQERK